jgi:hypothetical protein
VSAREQSQVLALLNRPLVLLGQKMAIVKSSSFADYEFKNLISLITINKLKEKKLDISILIIQYYFYILQTMN